MTDASPIQSLRDKAAASPADPQAWATLSRALYAARDYPGAIDALQKYQALDPFAADALAAQAAMDARTFGRAGGIALRIDKEVPGHPGAAIILARLYQMQGDPKMRAQTLQTAEQSFPAHPDIRRLLIGACEDCADYAGAVTAARDYADLVPTFDGVIGAMRVFLLYGLNDSVLEFSDQAYSLCAGDKALRSEVDLLRGHALKTLARRDEAIAAYRDCIANKPQNGTGWWSLADMKNYEFSNADADDMRAIAGAREIPAEQRSQALFALAKAEDIAGNGAAGMELYLKANAAHPAPPFQPEPFARAIAQIKDAFSLETLSKRAAPAGDEATPIFILGMPRSGSTLLEQILASHSQVEGTIEMPVLPTVKRLIHADCEKQFGGAYLHTLDRLSVDALQDAGRIYLQSSKFFRGEDTPFFTDKLPYNFEHVGLIHKILPNAKIIDARRNPLDCGLSIFRQHFGQGASFSYDLAHIGAYYKGYLDLMDYWDRVLPGKIIRVQYEDMVSDTEGQIRSLLDALGLDFEDNCLRFYENRRAVRTASSEQVRRPITNKSVGLWRNFDAALTPMKTALGDGLDRFERYLKM